MNVAPLDDYSRGYAEALRHDARLDRAAVIASGLIRDDMIFRVGAEKAADIAQNVFDILDALEREQAAREQQAR